MIPGDPARVMGGTDADRGRARGDPRRSTGSTIRSPLQYLRWIGLALRGDLGESIRTRESVVKTVARKLPITIELAVPLGADRARHRDSRRRLLGGAPQHALGSARQRRVPVRALDPELLARHHADPVPLGAAGWLPASGFVPLWERPARQPHAHDHARLRARHRARRGADAPDAQQHDRGPERRLYPHRVQQGPGRPRGRSSGTRSATGSSPS